MVTPKRVGHLVLNVKDQDASTKFYTEVLGFEIAIEQPGFGTFLTCGKIHHDLALFQAAVSTRRHPSRSTRITTNPSA